MGEVSLGETASCQGVALMLKDWKLLLGTARFLSCHSCQRQEAPLHLHPTCHFFNQSIPRWKGNTSHRADIFHLRQFTDQKGSGIISRETSCPKRIAVTSKMPPQAPYDKEGTIGEPLWLSSEMCCACRYFANLVVIYWFITVSFTEIYKIG